MATLDDQDLKNIKNLINVSFDEKLEEKGLATIKDDISHLPSKDEFYKETLKILKKLENIETEKDVLSAHSKTHTDQIEKLKSIHPNYQHPTL